jgi:hypothetical protein
MWQRAGRFGALVSLVVIAAACDWTTVGFDASRSGFNSLDKAITLENVGTLTPKWRAVLATAAGSDPVVAGGKVLATSSPTGNVTTGALQSYDARGETNCTGASPRTCLPLWSVSYPPVGFQATGMNLSAPTVTGPNVLVGGETLQSGGSFSGASAYSVSSGARVFTTSPGGRPSIAVAGGRMYASVTDIVRPIPIQTARYLAAFDGATGAKQFVATDLDTPSYGAPAIANGVLFAIAGGTKLEAFDAAGSTNCGTNPPPQWTDSVHAPKFCFPLWSATLPNPSSTQPAVANGLVYVTDSLGKISVFRAAGCGLPTCTATWTGAAGAKPLSSPAVTATSVFVGSNDGRLYAFPAAGCGAATCNATWTATAGAAAGAPSVAGSVLFVGSSDGHLRAFAAGGCGKPTCTALWDTNVGTPIATAPAVSDGRVFVTDTAGRLHAYGLP